MVLRGYFDEGGTHKGSPVTCVAGYLFFPEKGLAFPDKWATARLWRRICPQTQYFVRPTGGASPGITL